MDEKKSLLTTLLMSIVSMGVAILFLSACATCQPYVGAGRCHNYDWIPEHYEGLCFVPGHFMCYPGVHSCMGPWTEGYWKRCGYWKSGHYICHGSRQSWNRCKQYYCDRCEGLSYGRRRMYYHYPHPYAYYRAPFYRRWAWLPWNWHGRHAYPAMAMNAQAHPAVQGMPVVAAAKPTHSWSWPWNWRHRSTTPTAAHVTASAAVAAGPKMAMMDPAPVDSQRVVNSSSSNSPAISVATTQTARIDRSPSWLPWNWHRKS